MAFRRPQIFAFSCRDTGRIDIAICVAEDAEIDVALVNLRQIHALGLALLRGDFLEQKHLEELAENGILADILRKCPALLRELALNT